MPTLFIPEETLAKLIEEFPKIFEKAPSMFFVKTEGLTTANRSIFEKILRIEEDISVTITPDFFLLVDSTEQGSRLLELGSINLPDSSIVKFSPDPLVFICELGKHNPAAVAEAIAIRTLIEPKILVPYHDQLWLRFSSLDEVEKIKTVVIKLKGNELKFYNPWIKSPLTSSVKLQTISSSSDPMLVDVKVEKLIGSGQFGQVFLAKWSGIPVALKSFKTENLDTVQKEIANFRLNSILMLINTVTFDIETVF
jgi:hypothetical protein